MKVKELIEKLKKIDEDKEIFLHLDKKDVDRIDEMADEEPAFLLIGIDVGDTVFDFATIEIKE